MDGSSGPAVTLGLFDWVDADGVREAGQLYRERLDLGSPRSDLPGSPARGNPVAGA
jgi:hypothetical protein